MRFNTSVYLPDEVERKDEKQRVKGGEAGLGHRSSKHKEDEKQSRGSEGCEKKKKFESATGSERD